MPYNAVLIPAVPQRESGISTPRSPSLCLPPTPPPTIPRPRCHTGLSSLLQSHSPRAVCFTYRNVCASELFSQFAPPSPSHTVSTRLFFKPLFYSCLVFPSSLPDCTLCRVSSPSSLELLPQYACPFLFLFRFYSFFTAQVMFHC